MTMRWGGGGGMVWTNDSHSSLVHVQMASLAFKSLNVIYSKSHTMVGLFDIFSSKSSLSSLSHAKFDNNFTHFHSVFMLMLIQSRPSQMNPHIPISHQRMRVKKICMNQPQRTAFKSSKQPEKFSFKCINKYFFSYCVCRQKIRRN